MKTTERGLLRLVIVKWTLQKLAACVSSSIEKTIVRYKIDNLLRGSAFLSLHSDGPKSYFRRRKSATPPPPDDVIALSLRRVRALITGERRRGAPELGACRPRPTADRSNARLVPRYRDRGPCTAVGPRRDRPGRTPLSAVPLPRHRSVGRQRRRIGYAYLEHGFGLRDRDTTADVTPGQPGWCVCATAGLLVARRRVWTTRTRTRFFVVPGVRLATAAAEQDTAGRADWTY